MQIQNWPVQSSVRNKFEKFRPSEMICQPNNWIMLQMLEILSTQTIY